MDDDPPTADLVATVARYEGGEGVTAHSGEEALRRAAAFRPDLVVLDVMLPDSTAPAYWTGCAVPGRCCRWCSSPPARAHGGDIELSTGGPGPTVFTVRLPFDGPGPTGR